MARELVIYLVSTFNITNVNWSLQVKLAKTLLAEYSWNEVTYAINYYKNKGIDVYSLGYLLHGNNMKEPMSMYYAECHAQESDKSGERNRKRIELQQTECRTSYPCSLFTESSDAD